LALLFRVSKAKVRLWIRSGKLVADNVSDNADRPRMIVHPDELEAFRKRRRKEIPPAVKPPRRPRLPKGWVDYLPD
jgi:hypothetical protein